MQPSGSTRRVGSRLFATYALLSLVPVLSLGAVLVHDYRGQGRRHGLDQGRAQAAVIEQMAVAPALSGQDLARGLLPAERTRLQMATDLAVFSGSVDALRLRSFRGDVVYSDDGSTSASLSAADPAFQVAAAGGVDAVAVGDPDGTGRAVRVLLPVVANASGQAIGVLELYLPADAIEATVHDELTRTYWRLAEGLSLLYLVLACVSWTTSRRLRRHAAQREHASLHDGLTGLPNREWFRARAEQAVAERDRTGGGALVLVDLDHFKDINDTLGHHAGDALLTVVGQRLSGALRTDDSVARLGGDEFGLLLRGAAPQAELLALLTRVRERLSEEIVLEGVPLAVEASFGVALYPAHGDNVEQLLQHADAAMYRGKGGTAGIVFYDAAGESGTTHWLGLHGELRRALEREELVLHYQPKIDLATGDVCGVEALIRWAHPDRGLLSPAEFLPAVEQSGLIDPMSAWVVRRALLDQREWTRLGLDWSVAVNVSARNLESTAFLASVTALVAELDVAPGRLHVEVTETALAADAVGAARGVRALAALGIPISLDDFGTGWTSLSQLRTLPVAEVKVDRSFVLGLQTGPQDRAIVRSVIELAHGLGCLATAEGVEDGATVDWLTAAGCDQAQGYLFCRPAPWTELVERYRATTRLTTTMESPA